MKIVNIIGDITFYIHNNKLYQQIKSDMMFEVENGDMKYISIEKVNGYEI